jgi:hypothetical protein
MEKTASAMPPLRSAWACEPELALKKYGEKKCEALASPLTRESAAARLTLGRGMVEVTHAKDTAHATEDQSLQHERAPR